jgi:hypothetical protein
MSNKQSPIDYLYREMLLCDAELNANIIDVVAYLERKIKAFENAKQMQEELITELREKAISEIKDAKNQYIQACDACEFKPSVLYNTAKGTFCHECYKKQEKQWTGN